jgi:site-specific recombinase XerD
MVIIEWIINYRRFLKRRNYSPHTIKNYMNTLKHFILWVRVPVQEASPKTISEYIDFLLDKGLKPKTINSHLDSIRGFYHYLHREEEVAVVNPVKRGYVLRLPRPLPRYLKDDEVERFLAVPKKARDNAMFYLMLRCGLRVEEVANITLSNIDFRRGKILVCGKGAKDRVVYISKDAFHALLKYLKVRRFERAKGVFLVEKGTFKGKPISVRGIQKRMEYYAKKAGIKMSCHQLRHTMATQMLNADAELVTIQDLLGHSRIKTTQQYSKISNLKVQRDYYKAMEIILKRPT